MRCMECGRRFGVAEYIEEIDEKTWEKISNRSCNRV
ncbi:MAG: hypothetical protein M0Z67_07230 [Nitrospiraceae bacterium]|nr:hypothetical protein [Nitrospiraceae bacterium]